MIKHGSYREYQRHLCKDCDRTFNTKTGTIFAHAKIGLDKLLFAFYTLLRFNTSIHQPDAELDVSYRSLRRRPTEKVRKYLRERPVHQDSPHRNPLGSDRAIVRRAPSEIDREVTAVSNRRVAQQRASPDRDR